MSVLISTATQRHSRFMRLLPHDRRMSHPPRLPGIRFALTTLATLGLVACDASSEGTIDGPPPVDAGVDGPFDNGTTVVATTRVGDPRWETTGWQLAAVSSWAAADGVWAAHVFNSSVNAFGPGTPHAPPYDAEISDAMTRENTSVMKLTYAVPAHV